MEAALTAGGVLIAIGDVALVAICWRDKSVLGGVLGLVGIPLVLFSRLGAATRASSEQALVIAAGALVLGAALVALGRALERLLDTEPEDEA
jgi:hypothetical protein